MSILDHHGNPISSASRHFANAADRYDRSTPPQPLFKDDIDKLIPDMDRQFLVSGSRKLFQNFGPVTGALIQKADNAIGRAWAPKFTGEDKDWGMEAAAWLSDNWYGNCDVRGRAWDFKTLLWLDSVAIDRDGDFLIYLTEAESGYPLTQRISVNRIGQRTAYSRDTVIPDGPYKGAKMSHGVVLNKFKRAIAYHVLGDTVEEDRFIPADRCIHVFDPLWHDQVRGIPSFSGAIKLIYGSLTATEREQMNQLVRSSFALIEYNDTGGPDVDDPGYYAGSSGPDATAQPSVESLAGGMIKYFRSNSGGKLESVDNDTPGDMWDRFQDRVVRTAMSGINWPYELVWKSGEVNAALVRNIQERARMSVEDRQDVIKSPALFQVRYAIAKAVKVGILPKPKNASDWWRWDFGMPRKFSIDPGREAQQRRADFSIGLRNRTGIVSEEGGDVESLEDERIEEVFRRSRKIQEAQARYPDVAVDRREFFMLTPNEMPEAAEVEAEPKPAKKDEE